MEYCEAKKEGLPFPERRKLHAHNSKAELKRTTNRQQKFKHFHYEQTEGLIEFILQRLTAIDPDKTKWLLHELDMVTQRGVMPSFGDSGARSGYIKRRLLMRAFQVGSLFLHGDGKNSLFHLLQQPEIWLASIGGAGGSDAIGMVTLVRFMKKYFDFDQPVVKSMVYDFELGWAAPCMELGSSELFRSHEVNFSGIDVCKSLYAPENEHFLATVQQFHLFFFTYCLIENALALQETDFVFFRDLFKIMNGSGIFIISDSSWKLWDMIIGLSLPYGYQVHYPWGTETRNAFLLRSTKLKLNEFDFDDKLLANAKKFNVHTDLPSGWHSASSLPSCQQQDRSDTDNEQDINTPPPPFSCQQRQLLLDMKENRCDQIVQSEESFSSRIDDEEILAGCCGSFQDNDEFGCVISWRLSRTFLED
mmetsp:Transcript_39479/g.68196  ORF Transcript_39479/g.68196 Transcript_39479/m.68196 type:complete len:419 (+) Transcript_39479:98-1354(+)